VLAQPVVTKVEVSAKLCTRDGLTLTKMPRRAKADYAAAKRWRWGDAVRESQPLTTGRPGERRDP
jgi:ribosomal protein RSM22 (predicted rRNA methylase)